MLGPNVFSAPAKKIYFVVGPGPARARSKLVASLKLAEGCGVVHGRIQARGVKRFLRCRDEWCREAGIQAVVFDPAACRQLADDLREEFGIVANSTDFTLRETEFSCGDELILVYPRKNGRTDSETQTCARRYRFEAIRIGHPQCLGGSPETGMGGRFGDEAATPNLRDLLGAFGRPGPAQAPAAIRITIEIPPEMAGAMLGIGLKLLLARLFGSQGFGSRADEEPE